MRVHVSGSVGDDEASDEKEEEEGKSFNPMEEEERWKKKQSDVSGEKNGCCLQIYDRMLGKKLCLTRQLQ